MGWSTEMKKISDPCLQLGAEAAYGLNYHYVLGISRERFVGAWDAKS